MDGGTFTEQVGRLRAAGDVTGLLELAREQLRIEPRQALSLVDEIRAEHLATSEAPLALRIEALEIESSVLRRLGDLDAAEKAAEQGLEFADRTGDPAARRGPLFEMACVSRDRGEYEEAIRLLEEVIGILGGLEGSARPKAEAENSLAGVYFQRGDRPAAMRHASLARDLARECGDTGLLAGIEANLGILSELSGDHEGALEAQLRLVRLLREGNHRNELAGALNNVAVQYLHMDRTEEAVPLAEEAVRIRREFDDRRGEAIALNTLAQARAHLREWEAAREDIDRVLAIWEELGDRGQLSLALSVLATIAYCTDGREAAEPIFEDALRHAEESGNRNSALATLLKKGQMLVEVEEFAASIEPLENALSVAEELGDRRVVAEIHNFLRAAFEGLSDAERAYRHGRRHVDLMKELLDAASNARIDRLRLEHELSEERANAAAALRESERKYSEVFRASPETMTIIRLEDERLLDVNDGFLEAGGWSREEVIGKSTRELGIWVDEQDLEDGLAMVRRGEVFSRECRFLRPSGETRVVEIFAKPVEIDGQACAVTAGRDITERRRAEEELKEAYAEVERLKDRLQAENIYLREQINEDQDFGEIVGGHETVVELLRTIKRVADTDATVLVTGETGTGKELVARALHRLSSRQDRALVKVNCSAVSAGLVESELFGHVKGAFTGAHQDRQGRFEIAHGGTILLDEVGELPPETQVKLLRVLEEHEFERVGSSETISVDVRTIAATNRDLERAIDEGTFRADLFYRLNVFPIRVPPLRERPTDIPLLARHFLERAGRRLGRNYDGFHAEAEDWMSRYHWPGNVRELKNLVERAAILARGPVVNLEGAGPARPPAPEPATRDLATIERDHIRSTLEAAGWVIEGPRGAATMLGLAPSTLRSRMKKLRISRR